MYRFALHNNIKSNFSINFYYFERCVELASLLIYYYYYIFFFYIYDFLIHYFLQPINGQLLAVDVYIITILLIYIIAVYANILLLGKLYKKYYTQWNVAMMSHNLWKCIGPIDRSIKNSEITILNCRNFSFQNNIHVIIPCATRSWILSIVTDSRKCMEIHYFYR